jgi:hypothetical protein
MHSSDCSPLYRWFDWLTRCVFISLGLTLSYMVFVPMWWGGTPDLVKLWGLMFFIITAFFLGHRSRSPYYGWPLWLTSIAVSSIVVVLTYNAIASEGYSGGTGMGAGLGAGEPPHVLPGTGAGKSRSQPAQPKSGMGGAPAKL